MSMRAVPKGAPAARRRAPRRPAASPRGKARSRSPARLEGALVLRLLEGGTGTRAASRGRCGPAFPGEVDVDPALLAVVGHGTCRACSPRPRPGRAASAARAPPARDASAPRMNAVQTRGSARRAYAATNSRPSSSSVCDAGAAPACRARRCSCALASVSRCSTSSPAGRRRAGCAPLLREPARRLGQDDAAAHGRGEPADAPRSCTAQSGRARKRTYVLGSTDAHVVWLGSTLSTRFRSASSRM